MRKIVLALSISLFLGFIISSCSDDPSSPSSKIVKGVWNGEIQANDTLYKVEMTPNCDCTSLKGVCEIKKYLVTSPDTEVGIDVLYIFGEFSNPHLSSNFVFEKDSIQTIQAALNDKINQAIINSEQGNADKITGVFYPKAQWDTDIANIVYNQGYDIILTKTAEID
jgi:hypothetical protein